MPASALRYLAADELSGGSAMYALRRTLLDSPSQRCQETVRARALEFSIEMQVALDKLESAPGIAPPTSAW